LPLFAVVYRFADLILLLLYKKYGSSGAGERNEKMAAIIRFGYFQATALLHWLPVLPVEISV